MLEVADRTIPGVGSTVTLYCRDADCLVTISDDDARKVFSFTVAPENALTGFHHPYLFAPATVLAVVNDRGIVHADDDSEMVNFDNWPMDDRQTA